MNKNELTRTASLSDLQKQATARRLGDMSLGVVVCKIKLLHNDLLISAGSSCHSNLFKVFKLEPVTKYS